MIKNYLKLTLYVYYCSLIALSILYLFPGSLIGYLLYGDFGKQPNLIPNPLGTSINHALAFFYISILSLLTYKKKENLKKTIIFLVSFGALVIPILSKSIQFTLFLERIFSISSIILRSSSIFFFDISILLFL